MFFFYSLVGVVSEKIWGMIKITDSYQISGYNALELVVESQSISTYDHYDPCPTNILESSNPVLAEERTHARAQE
jgi:hypothetical protein